MNATNEYTDIAEARELTQTTNKDLPFSLLKLIQPEQVAQVLSEETALTIAIVLSHLDTSNAADILGFLNSDLKIEVAIRMSDLKDIPPSAVKNISILLESKIISFNSDKSLDENIKKLGSIFYKMGQKGKDTLTLIKLYDEGLAQKIEAEISAM